MGGGWWQEYEDRAQFYGGHLATIDNLTLNNWLKTTYGGYGDYLAIGLHYDSSYGSQSAMNWRWASTGSNSPLYRNFAATYPKNGTSSGFDFALLRTLDGKWIDMFPLQSGIGPTAAIYETDYASVVLVTMNCSVHCTANWQENSGLNSTSMDNLFEMSDPEQPWNINQTFSHSSISCTGDD